MNVLNTCLVVVLLVCSQTCSQLDAVVYQVCNSQFVHQYISTCKCVSSQGFVTSLLLTKCRTTYHNYHRPNLRCVYVVDRGYWLSSHVRKQLLASLPRVLQQGPLRATVSNTGASSCLGCRSIAYWWYLSSCVPVGDWEANDGDNVKWCSAIT